MFGLICPIIRGKYDKFIKVLNDKSAIIKIQGITHLIIEDQNINEKYDKEELKKYSLDILRKNNLLSEPAAGVMYVNYVDANTIKLTPIVFVKEINTLFYETACGSGTVAVGLYESYKKKSNVCFDIIQPSNKKINVKVTANFKQVYNARISGNVEEVEIKGQ